MLRSAAKNNADVSVLVDPADYRVVLDEMKATGGAVAKNTNFRLAVKVYQHTAAYDGAISNWLGKKLGEDDAVFPPVLTLQYRKAQGMRYGENPHQGAAFYVERDVREASIATARQLQGKELSYNNIGDTDAALECVKQFTEGPACVIVKHANPCGVAIGATLFDSVDSASEFFRKDATGWSPDRIGRLEGLRLDTDAWHVDAAEPIHVESSLFDSLPAGSAQLDFALVMRNVPVTWSTPRELVDLAP